MSSLEQRLEELRIADEEYIMNLQRQFTERTTDTIREIENDDAASLVRVGEILNAKVEQIIALRLREVEVMHREQEEVTRGLIARYTRLQIVGNEEKILQFAAALHRIDSLTLAENLLQAGNRRLLDNYIADSRRRYNSTCEEHLAEIHQRIDIVDASIIGIIKSSDEAFRHNLLVESLLPEEIDEAIVERNISRNRSAASKRIQKDLRDHIVSLSETDSNRRVLQVLESLSLEELERHAQRLQFMSEPN